jgi:hypothetical protein
MPLSVDAEIEKLKDWNLNSLALARQGDKVCRVITSMAWADGLMRRQQCVHKFQPISLHGGWW